MKTIARKRRRPQLAVSTFDFLPVNRNFGYYPLARSDRLRPDWQLLSDKGYSRCKLNRHVRLRLPKRLRWRRVPTGFDMVVLFTLGALALARGQTINITNSDLLRHMGEPITSRTRKKVVDALTLWEHLTIVHRNWYEPGKGKITRIIHPPITREGKKLIVSEQWVRICTSYFAKVPIPLATDYSVQNLFLVLLASKRWDSDDGSSNIREFKSKRTLTRMIGLEHSTRNDRLKKAVKSVRAAFSEAGGSCESDLEGETIEFICTH